MESFQEFCERKTREAASSRLGSLETVEDRSATYPGLEIGNRWTREHYDGPFYIPRPGASPTPSVSLVFVQSQDGNTGIDNPEDLGGGPIDKHLIYEGLSRVAADAVLAGAKTAADENTFFSVWHPELVALRCDLGFDRHPAQIVVTGRGCIDVEVSRLFNVPQVPVYVVASPGACQILQRVISARTWVRLVPMDDNDLRRPLAYLANECGIRRISAVGGRTTASALLDQGLVQDICLTTTARHTGDPHTPLYVGKWPPRTTTIVRKRSLDPDYRMVFEHLAVRERFKD